MTPQDQESDPRHSGKAWHSCSTRAALCKMMSSARHARKEALLLLLMGLQHYCTEMMKGKHHKLGVTQPLKTINSLKLQEEILSGEDTPQTSLEIENTSK